MFDKLKQLSQLKEIRNNLSQEKLTVEKNGIRVTFNGKMEIEELQLNPSLNAKEQEKILKDCLNEAIRKLQLVLAKKMSQMPGFGL